MTRPLPAQPTTPAIRLENERAFAVAEVTPLPTRQQLQQVPPAPHETYGIYAICRLSRGTGAVDQGLLFPYL